MAMPDTATSPPRSPAPRDQRRQRVGLYAMVLTIAFLLGWVPMWLTARERARELETLEQQLRATQLENQLARAALLARRGEYEAAREAASRFYTDAGQEIAGDRLPQFQRESLRTLIADRDDIITLLARSDPSSAERLAELYVAYQQLPRENGPSASPTVPDPTR
jgi:hypothetical protein